MSQARAVAYGVIVLVIAAMLWASYSFVRDHFQAPIKAELATAQAERDEAKMLAKANADARDELNQKLLARDAFEARVNVRLGRLNDELSKLRNTDPAVRDWSDTVIPLGVIRLRDVPAKDKDGSAGMQSRSSAETTGISPSPAQ